MSAAGDSLKSAADSLYSAIVSGAEVDGDEYKVRYEVLRIALSAYIDATEATIADHESRITALEP